MKMALHMPNNYVEVMQRDFITASGSATGALIGVAIDSAAGSISRGTINGSRTWYIDVPLVLDASFYLP